MGKNFVEKGLAAITVDAARNSCYLDYDALTQKTSWKKVTWCERILRVLFWWIPCLSSTYRKCFECSKVAFLQAGIAGHAAKRIDDIEASLEVATKDKALESVKALFTRFLEIVRETKGLLSNTTEFVTATPRSGQSSAASTPTNDGSRLSLFTPTHLDIETERSKKIDALRKIDTLTTQHASEIKAKESELAKLVRQVREQSEKHDTLKSRISTLEGEASSAKSRHENEMKASASEIAALKSQAKEHERQHSASKQRIELLEAEQVSMQSKHKSELSEKESALTALRTKEQSLASSIESLNQRISALQNDAKTAKDQHQAAISHKESDIASLRHKVSEYETTKSDLLQQISTLSALSAHTSEAHNQIMAIAKQKVTPPSPTKPPKMSHAASSDESGSKEAADGPAVELAALKEQLKTVTSKEQTALQQIQKLTSDASLATKQHELAISGKESRIKELTDAAAAKASEFTALNQSIDSMRAEIQAAAERHSKELKAKDEEIASEQLKASTSAASLSKAELKIAELDSKMQTAAEEHKAAIESKDAEIAELRKSVDSLQAKGSPQKRKHAGGGAGTEAGAVIDELFVEEASDAEHAMLAAQESAKRAAEMTIAAEHRASEAEKRASKAEKERDLALERLRLFDEHLKAAESRAQHLDVVRYKAFSTIAAAMEPESAPVTPVDMGPSEPTSAKDTSAPTLPRRSSRLHRRSNSVVDLKGFKTNDADFAAVKKSLIEEAEAQKALDALLPAKPKSRPTTPVNPTADTAVVGSTVAAVASAVVTVAAAIETRTKIEKSVPPTTAKKGKPPTKPFIVLTPLKTRKGTQYGTKQRVPLFSSANPTGSVPSSFSASLFSPVRTRTHAHANCVPGQHDRGSSAATATATAAIVAPKPQRTQSLMVGGVALSSKGGGGSSGVATSFRVPTPKSAEAKSSGGAPTKSTTPTPTSGTNVAATKSGPTPPLPSSTPPPSTGSVVTATAAPTKSAVTPPPTSITPPPSSSGTVADNDASDTTATVAATAAASAHSGSLSAATSSDSPTTDPVSPGGTSRRNRRNRKKGGKGGGTAHAKSDPKQSSTQLKTKRK